MLKKNGFIKRYRLVNKPRFIFCMTAAAMLVMAVIFIISDLAGTPGLAEDALADASNTNNPATTAKPADDWKLALVNATHPLPEGFHVDTLAVPNGMQFDARAIDDLTRMMDAGKQQGLSFVICSAYRTFTKQKELFDEQVATEQATGLSHEKAVETAKTKVALPGTSEHNLGLAVDIVAYDYQKLDEGYLDTPECKWLRENSYKYGFIMRYPQDKSAITGIIFEPWHYRYVGVKAATEIAQKGLCLEEYLGMAD